MDLINKIKKNIYQYDLCRTADTLIIGVSGGVDSVVLTKGLHALHYKLGLHLIVAHYNHNLRKDSQKDELFVKQLAEQLNLPFYSGRWTRPPKNPSGSIEELARIKRLTFFKKIAKKTCVHIVALAHTDDDLAETVLMRILRGTGLQGFQGIRPKREVEGLTLIRPLLGLGKKDILDFAKKNKICYRNDPTNAQTIFFRNKIRRKLLPLLKKEYNPNISSVLTGLSQNLSIDYSFLDTLSRKAFKKMTPKESSQRISFNLKKFLNQPRALRRHILRLAYETIKGDTRAFSSQHMEEIEDLVQHRPFGSIVHLPHQLQIKKTTSSLILSRRSIKKKT